MTSDLGQPAAAFASIGIDIGKEIFHVVGFDAAGKVILRKKFKRLALEREFEKLPPSIVGLAVPRQIAYRQAATHLRATSEPHHRGPESYRAAQGCLTQRALRDFRRPGSFR